MMRIAFIFSGKGSQYFHMGRELYEADNEFRHHIDRLDGIAEQLTGISVFRAVFDPTQRRATPISDPVISVLAIFIIECALGHRLSSAGVKPGLIISSSMGIYAAAVLAGCLTELESLRYLCRSARIFRQSCAPGSMVTVLAARRELEASPRLRSLTELAAESFDTHCTLACLSADRGAVEQELSRLEFIFQFLPISRPYHSRWIDDAREPFLEMFAGHQNRPSTISLACCSGNAEIDMVTGTTIWSAIRKPMYFKHLLETIEITGPWHYVDTGPSGASATALKYVLGRGSNSTSHTILAPMPGDLNRFAKVVSLLGSLALPRQVNDADYLRRRGSGAL